MKVLSIHDKEFSKFGKVLDEKECVEKLLPILDTFPIPDVMNTYSPSEKALEEVGTKALSKYFEKDIQIGYCNGRGKNLNSMEYHESVEIDIALGDAVLFLGRYEGVNDIDTSSFVPFSVKKGDAVLLYEKTLHFAPLDITGNGFKAVIVLPKNTNYPIPNDEKKGTYFMTNKWLIAHNEHTKMVENGAYVGLFGKNYSVDDLEF